MGGYCSIEKDEGDHEEKAPMGFLSRTSPHKLIRRQHAHERSTRTMDEANDIAQPQVRRNIEYNNARALDEVVRKRRNAAQTRHVQQSNVARESSADVAETLDKVNQKRTATPNMTSLQIGGAIESRQHYDVTRRELQEREKTLGFEFACQSSATPAEIKANRVIRLLKPRDRLEVFHEAKNDVFGVEKLTKAQKAALEGDALTWYEAEERALDAEAATLSAEDTEYRAQCEMMRGALDPGENQKRSGYRGQKHPVAYGDHFLSNVDYISRTKLFKIAQAMPKAAHLHIHFNANLEPAFLLEIAQHQQQMFISSDIPLNNRENFDLCEIQFSITPENEVRAVLDGQDNWFAEPFGKEGRMRMRFTDFLAQFDKRCRVVVPEQWQELNDRYQMTGKSPAMHWLEDKLVFHEEEAHGVHQTPKGAWEKFNGRTRMMKGLFNYKAAYQKYTRKCLIEFMKENILYAEIRPNFMNSNQVFTDDGVGRLDNSHIMELIINEYKKFQNDLEAERRRRRREEREEGPEKWQKTSGTGPSTRSATAQQRREEAQAATQVSLDNADLREGPCYFGGLKIIYCTPRSFDPERVRKALEQCGEFWDREDFKPYLAGFDLVGEEGADKWPLSMFVDEFIEFRKRYKADQIPFLFHCGETIDIGTPTDGNLVDALLLGSKRIGHGFALSRHPYIMEQMKARNICLELCPISNEILGLTPRVNGHSMYQLLANDVHCTVSSDNPTLFR
jgi:adenosine deaminase